MKRRHMLASMGAFTAGGSLVIGSGAFSSVEANREVAVDVVGDPDAYLGLVYPSEGGESEPQKVVVASGERENLFKATNQVTAEIEEFNLEILEGEGDFDTIELHEKDTENCIQPETDEFGVGDCAQIEIELECSEEVTGTLELEIEAKGEGEHFDIIGVRTWDSLVECTPPGVDIGGLSWVSFCGSVDDTDIEFDYLFEEDGRIEGVEWELKEDSDGSLERVVLWGGFGEFTWGDFGVNCEDIDEVDCNGFDQSDSPNGPVYLSFDVDEESGEAIIGEQNELRYPSGPERGTLASCPCDKEGDGVKYNLNDDGTIADTEGMNCD